jgi:CBS domain containing-hemolysin-like protein
VLVFISLALIALNGLFVAAEFALVNIRPSRIDSWVAQKRLFAKLVRTQFRNLEESISACQLGRTISSLALGWLGEPAFAALLEPHFSTVFGNSSAITQGVSLLLAFMVIATLHLTLGEQIPKVVALTRPESIATFCAMPLRVFRLICFPFLMSLNGISRALLNLFGVTEFVAHDSAHTEDEIRSLMGRAHLQGQLTRTEHRLLNAVFEFDDRVVREIMLPKKDVVFLESSESPKKLLELIRATKHSRYPYGHGSLDEVEGVLHIKDLLGIEIDDSFDFRTMLRPPHKVPEGLEISKLLRQFQATKQHMAFVMDEFGNVIGAVTMENVIEQIVGAVQDEFDIEDPLIVPEQNGVYLVDGGISLELLEKSLNFEFDESDADTLSGFLTFKLEQLPKEGDEVDLGNYVAEVVETLDSCAEKVRIREKQIS